MGDGMRIVKATPIATGYGIGVVQFLAHANPAPAADTTDVIDWETEWGRFVKAQEQACRELEALKQELVREAYRHRTSLFDAHMLLLEESELVPSVKNQLRVKGCGTEEAVTEVIEALANMFETLAQSYGERRTRGLSERSESRPDLPEGRWIVAAKELLPPHTATLDLTSTVGLLTEQGGATSHAAMLARARGIPAVAVPPTVWEHVSSGDTVIIDGTKGEVIIRPDGEAWARGCHRQARALQAQDRWHRPDPAPAVTMDGESVVVGANVTCVEDAHRANKVGADAIAMFRTELLYKDSRYPPTEGEQLASYREIVRAFSGKPMFWLAPDAVPDRWALSQSCDASAGRESNPLLGMRGLRFFLKHPDLFVTHLRAIVRSVRDQLFVTFPRVTTVAELKQARALLEGVFRQLAAENFPMPASIQVGIMVETPAVALAVDRFAPHVDFFGLRTDQLTQHGLGVDRGNPRVAHLYKPFHPGMLHMMAEFVGKALAANKPVTIGSELADDPLAVALFIGMGVRRFSVAPDNVPRIKAAVRTIHAAAAKEAVSRVLQAADDEAALAVLDRLYHPTNGEID